MPTPPRHLSIPATMRAWQFSTTRGGLEKNLRLNTSAPVPAHDAKALGRDKVLVRVVAAAINPVDYKLPELPVLGRLLYGAGAVPGSDFAGVVATTATSTPTTTNPAAAATAGEGEEGIKEGQIVFGKLKQPTKHGTLEEYIIVKREKLVPVPEGVDPMHAAGVGVAGLTAYQCIQPYVHAGQGDRVFINGGSGGTGVWAIQFAKALGCYVVASCSGSNVELCKNLGADEVVDYRSTDVVDALKKLGGSGGRKFDLVVDNVGNSPALYWQSPQYLSESGRYVQVGVEPGLGTMWDLLMKIIWPGFLVGGKRKFEMLRVQDNAKHLAEIGKWMQQGKVRTVLHNGTVLAMEDSAQAFATLKTHRAKGKIVIQVSDE